MPPAIHIAVALACLSPVHVFGIRRGNEQTALQRKADLPKSLNAIGAILLSNGGVGCHRQGNAGHAYVGLQRRGVLVRCGDSESADLSVSRDEHTPYNASIGAHVAAMKLVNNGQAVSLKEALSYNARRARLSQALTLIENGTVATLDDALSLQGKKMVSARRAKYSKDDISKFARRAGLKSAQRMVDSGEAATLEEALSIRGKKMVAARKAKAARDQVDLLTQQGRLAIEERIVNDEKIGNLSTYTDSVEAMPDMSELLPMLTTDNIHLAGADDVVALEGIRSGQAHARKYGKYTNYAGVHQRKDSGKWRVHFRYRGKRLSVAGTFDSEHEAALAHDKYVKDNMLVRPLHFPRYGEKS